MEDIQPVYVEGTIIVVAVYMNNDFNNYNELVKCLTQLRHIYVDHTIVAIDNGSLNNKWYDTANILNIIIGVIFNERKSRKSIK